MPCSVDLFIYPPLSNTPEDLSLWKTFMDKVRRMSTRPEWRRFMRYEDAPLPYGPTIRFYDGEDISEDNGLCSLRYNEALLFRSFRYQLVGLYLDDLIDLYNHVEELAKSVFCPARKVDGGVEYREPFYSLDEIHFPTPPCLRCGHWRITIEPGDEELYNDVPLKEGVKSEGLCRTCEVHDITQSLKVIGEICVQYNLPAGDPCWMAEMIGTYADWRVEPPRQPFIPMRPPTCTYFLRGACLFGARCRHAHPEDRKLGHCAVHPPAFAVGRTFYGAVCTCGNGSTCESIPWPHGPH